MSEKRIKLLFGERNRKNTGTMETRVYVGYLGWCHIQFSEFPDPGSPTQLGKAKIGLVAKHALIREVKATAVRSRLAYGL